MIKKKVGVIIDRALEKAGGVERSTITIIKALNQQGFTVDLLSLHEPKLNEIERIFGEKIDIERVYSPRISVPFKQFFGNFLLLKFVPELSKRVDFFIIIDGMWLQNFVSNYFVYQLSVPDPKFYTAHSGGVFKKILMNLRAVLIFKLLRPSYRYKVIAHSKVTEKQLLNVYHKQSSGILYPAINENFFNHIQEDKQNKIVCIGRFSPEKNFEFAIHSLYRVVKERKDVLLYLIGSMHSRRTSDDYINYLKNLVSTLGLTKNVVFLTNVSESKLISQLRESKILLSLQVEPETFNISIIEGMAAGCVPLVPKCERGAWDEILVDGKYGFGFCDVEECAQVILNLMNLNDCEFLRYSSLSIERAKDFDKKNFEQQLIRILMGKK